MRPPVATTRRRRREPGDEVDAAVRQRLAGLLLSTTKLSAVESTLVVAVVCAYAVLPGHPPINDTAFAVLLVVVSAVTVVLALQLRHRPADDLVTALLFVAWGLIDIAAISAGIAVSGGARSDLYLVYLVLAVFQGGTGFPRGTRLAFEGLSAVAYVATLAATGWHIGAGTLVIRLGMIAVLAWGTDMLSVRLVDEFRHQVEQSLDSQRRARLWRKVADLAPTLASLDPDTVLDWSLEAMAGLGYDAASVSLVDEGRDEYRVVRSVGLPEVFTGTVHPLTVGAIGAVVARRGTVVLDYAEFDAAVPSVQALGMRTVIGVPIRTGAEVTAVLVAGTRALRRPAEEELAALEVVAAHAAQGLAQARSFDDQRRDADRLRTILAAAPDAMLVFTPDLLIVRANDQAARLYGTTPDELVGTAVTELGDEHAADRLRALTAGLLRADRDTVVEAGELPGRRRDGTGFPAEVTLAPVTTPEGRLVTATVRDISERLAFQQELAHHATHDDLTGLPNRTLFLGRLTEALRRDGEGPAAAVCFLDVDHFKYVNDSRGHGVGDDLVVQVAERLRQAGGDELVARFGGDEFALLTTAVLDSDHALGWAWRWLGALDAPFVLDGVECHVSASAGVAFGAHGDTAHDVMQRADAAMYWAKQRGRSRVELFDETLTARAAWRLDVASALHDAVERQELFLEYQPVVALDSAEVTGLEALLRWRRPSGLVGPADFIPVAEDSGLIVPIGRWVLQQACRRAATWFADAPDGDQLRISVNVSSRQLDHDQFIGDVAAVIEDTGIRPQCLVLEITESSFMDDLPAAVRRLDALRRLGVQVAIDDFGTGFSSLSSLSRLPIDAVKIDKSFVDGLGTRYDTVTQAVVDVARTFDLRVVAEGVERAAQAATLQVLGCRLAQGFLYARPLPADEAELAVKRRRCPTTH